MQSSPISARLSPVNGGLALLSNCINVFAVVIPPTQFVCGAIGGLFSLGALVTGTVGLVQAKREGNLQQAKGWAIAGIVLGVLGMMGACLIPLFGATILAALGLQIGNMILVPVE
jgi:hypothetical protein